MVEHDDNLGPDSEQGVGIAEWKFDSGPPHEWGFPETATSQQRRCWADQERFLAAFAERGRPYQSCRAAGITVHAYHWWQAKDLYSFQKRLERAEQVFVEKLESEVERRALQGIDHPVIYQGEITTTYKEYSDNLLMFYLKKLRPEYRDNYRVSTDAEEAALKLWNQLKELAAQSQPAELEGSVVEGQYRDVPETENSEGRTP